MASKIYVPAGWTVSKDDPPGPILLRKAAKALMNLQRLSETVRSEHDPNILLWMIDLTHKKGPRYPEAREALNVLGQRFEYTFRKANVKEVTMQADVEYARLKDGVPQEKPYVSQANTPATEGGVA